MPISNLCKLLAFLIIILIDININNLNSANLIDNTIYQQFEQDLKINRSYYTYYGKITYSNFITNTDSLNYYLVDHKRIQFLYNLFFYDDFLIIIIDNQTHHKQVSSILKPLIHHLKTLYDQDAKIHINFISHLNNPQINTNETPYLFIYRKRIYY